MRALTAADGPTRIALADVDEPRPLPDEAIVDVRAVSVNRGEVRNLQAKAPGAPTGWDLAGVVREPARDGSGPARGTRVVGCSSRAESWAQRVAVPTTALAAIPDAVSFGQAACLPVAGLTAMRALARIGGVLGRRVLITGASGGVGRVAIQLAAMSGAHVTAVARRTSGLAGLGADAVAPAIDPAAERFDAVIDGIGGPVLAAAIGRLVPDGIAVAYASTIAGPVSFPTAALIEDAPGASVHALSLLHDLARGYDAAADLRRLGELVAGGALDPQIVRIASWREAADAMGALMDGRVAGKIVLEID